MIVGLDEHYFGHNSYFLIEFANSSRQDLLNLYWGARESIYSNRTLFQEVDQRQAQITNCCQDTPLGGLAASPPSLLSQGVPPLHPSSYMK